MRLSKSRVTDDVEIKPEDPADEFRALIRKAYAHIQGLSDKNIILFVGPTGGGKSTIFNYLFKRKMLRKRDEHDLRYIIDCENPIATIGHSKRSETEWPFLYLLEDSHLDFSYVDCPGFFENRGADAELRANMSIYLSTKLASSVKAIAIMIPYAVIDSEARGHLFRDVAKSLNKFITNLSQHSSSIIFIITKCPYDSNGKMPTKKVILTLINQFKQDLDGLALSTKEQTAFLEVLNFMSHPEVNIIIPDVLDHGASRIKLENVFLAAKPIAKECFRFTAQHDAENKMKEMGMKIIKQQYVKLKRYRDAHAQIENLPKKIADKQAEKEALRENLRKLRIRNDDLWQKNQGALGACDRKITEIESTLQQKITQLKTDTEQKTTQLTQKKKAVTISTAIGTKIRTLSQELERKRKNRIKLLRELREKNATIGVPFQNEIDKCETNLEKIKKAIDEKRRLKNKKQEEIDSLKKKREALAKKIGDLDTDDVEKYPVCIFNPGSKIFPSTIPISYTIKGAVNYEITQCYGGGFITENFTNATGTFNGRFRNNCHSKPRVEISFHMARRDIPKNKNVLTQLQRDLKKLDAEIATAVSAYDLLETEILALETDKRSIKKEIEKHQRSKEQAVSTLETQIDESRNESFEEKSLKHRIVEAEQQGEAEKLREIDNIDREIVGLQSELVKRSAQYSSQITQAEQSAEAEKRSIEQKFSLDQQEVFAEDKKISEMIEKVDTEIKRLQRDLMRAERNFSELKSGSGIESEMEDSNLALDLLMQTDSLSQELTQLLDSYTTQKTFVTEHESSITINPQSKEPLDKIIQENKKLRIEKAFNSFLASCSALVDDSSEAFISYAWEEQEEAMQPLHYCLKQLVEYGEKAGLKKVWLDINDAGTNLHEYMLDKIAKSRYIFIVGTPRGFSKLSDESGPNNFKTEYQRILMKDKGSYHLIPLLLEGERETAFISAISQKTLVRDMRPVIKHIFDPIEYLIAMISVFSRLDNPMGILPLFCNTDINQSNKSLYKQLLKGLEGELKQEGIAIKELLHTVRPAVSTHAFSRRPHSSRLFKFSEPSAGGDQQLTEGKNSSFLPVS